MRAWFIGVGILMAKHEKQVVFFHSSEFFGIERYTVNKLKIAQPYSRVLS